MSELCPVAVPLTVEDETQAETATEAFLSFLKKKRLCDVTFVFENAPDKIEAHQFCLRARSPVFDSMFRGMGSVASTREVKIEDASPEIVDKFLQFIYADKFDVTAAQALHLLQLGHKYKVEPLVNKCEALIGKGISTENAIEIYEAAEEYGLMDLRDGACDVIARSLEDFLQDPKMMKIKGTTLVALLKRTDLMVPESDLFQLAVQWGQNNSSGDHELAVALTEILPLIRYTDMTPEEFTTVVWPTKLIPLEDTANIYAYISGDDSTKAAILPSLKFEASSRLAALAVEPTFETEVMFIKDDPPWRATRQGIGSVPYKECISFSTTMVTPSWEKEQSFKIESVFVKWPTREVRGETSTQLPINFKVVIMGKHSGLEHTYKTMSQTFACHCKGACEVEVDPPVRIYNDFDYCIAVVDEYPDSAPAYSWSSERKYTYDSDPVKISQYLHNTAIIYKATKLNILSPKRNDCPDACATTRSYNAVYVIRGILITEGD